MTWGFVQPPQPAAKQNVTRKHQDDGTGAEEGSDAMTPAHARITCLGCSLRTVAVDFCRGNPEPGEIAGARFVARLVAIMRGWIADGATVGYCPTCRAGLRLPDERREAVRS